ncbi:hypothetical protein EJ02DRAFT_232548 [Clathrospora elynae]|uniref:F-box domain-containing protein n=1 Tax=Clathrospora elynae TaxID=706981 RepID=A0A6A5T3A3_9PLEO|nr:hypothetical protein EJ02DRAFT_232548 [Clathrospora elynae]
MSHSLLFVSISAPHDPSLSQVVLAMKKILFRRAKVRLRRALGFLKLSKSVKSDTRLLNRDPLTPRMVARTRNPTTKPAIEQLALDQTSLSLEDKPTNITSFLDLPAELRNKIHSYLMPDVTHLEDVTGLMYACKKIRQELSTMVLAETNLVLEEAEQQSTALRKSIWEEEEEPGPLITLPHVQTHSQLCNVTFFIPMLYRVLAASRPSGPATHRISMSEAFGDLKKVLGLQLPYLTVSIPCKVIGNANFGQPEIRYRFLSTCYQTFKDMQESFQINMQHVIFDLAHSRWVSETLEHPPLISFVRQVCRKGKVGYGFMGHDPRFELSHAVERYGCDKYHPTDPKMMERLGKIVKRSKMAALGGSSC